jgi:hypothetical protein
MEFQKFPSIARLSRDVIVTEKIDGTNAQIFIALDGDQMLIGSRTRWITPAEDNYGFAAWCMANEDEIRKLGPGRHFGEWWGPGVQRGYGIKEKRLSLFNVARWHLAGEIPRLIHTQDPRIIKTTHELPTCVGLVPVLWQGIFDTGMIEGVLTHLAATGSKASPGFMTPEGIVAFHVNGNVGFKKTLGDDGHKSAKG